MFMIENTVTLVATDLDGTLLNNKKEVSEINKKAIRDLKQNGIFFGNENFISLVNCVNSLSVGDL